MLLRHSINFAQQTYKVKNTGSNDATVDLQFREAGGGTSGFDSAIGFPQTLAAGDTLWINSDEAHHFTRLLVSSVAAGSNNTVTVEWMAKT